MSGRNATALFSLSLFPFSTFFFLFISIYLCPFPSARTRRWLASTTEALRLAGESTIAEEAEQTEGEAATIIAELAEVLLALTTEEEEEASTVGEEEEEVESTVAEEAIVKTIAGAALHWREAAEEEDLAELEDAAEVGQGKGQGRESLDEDSIEI